MKTTHDAQYWKEKLRLTSHVEGGSFKEVYRSELTFSRSVLTDDHNGDRNASTSIYFLLEQGQFSALHKIASDEVWHLYDGGPLAIYEINKKGELIKHLLGKDIDKGEAPQITIPAGSWFGSRVEDGVDYALCGCTVAPGFDFEDFELADRKELVSQFPDHEVIINELT